MHFPRVLAAEKGEAGMKFITLCWTWYLHLRRNPVMAWKQLHAVAYVAGKMGSRIAERVKRS